MRNSKGFSILRYEAGGFYKRHHDFVLEATDPALWKLCGPRVFTFMVYVTDVGAGGETDFFHLGVRVKPKLGRALLWTNTFVDQPLVKDERSAHEALVVREGVKLTATEWLHECSCET